MSSDQLSPGDAKRQSVIDTATALFRDLFAAHVDEAAAHARDVAEDKGKATEAKMRFAVAFDPESETPSVRIKIAWGSPRSDETEAAANQTQLPLP